MDTDQYVQRSSRSERLSDHLLRRIRLRQIRCDVVQRSPRSEVTAHVRQDLGKIISSPRLLHVMCPMVLDHTTASRRLGSTCWISLSLYFVVEAWVISRSAAPYDAMQELMSDLGVTRCGVGTYPLGDYAVCSPAHLLMNWTFTLTGAVIIAGALLLHQSWPAGRRAVIATSLWTIYGASYAVSGVVPADVSFSVHMLAALPGMIAQIPAMVLTAGMTRGRQSALLGWTVVCLVASSAALILLFLQHLLPAVPGGLLQRVLYGAVFFWMAGAGLQLLRQNVARADRTP